jgi:hypothetical protein
MTLTQRFLDQIIRNIDKHQAVLLRNEIKRLAHLGNIDFSDLTPKQKNDVLKTIDKLFNNFKLLHSDFEIISKKENNFTNFFRVTRFPRNIEFSLFWDHIQLVDNLNNDLSQQNFNKLNMFLANFGSLKIQDQTLGDFGTKLLASIIQIFFQKVYFV